MCLPFSFGSSNIRWIRHNLSSSRTHIHSSSWTPLRPRIDENIYRKLPNFRCLVGFPFNPLRPFQVPDNDALRDFFGDRRAPLCKGDSVEPVEQWLRGSAQGRADLRGSKVLQGKCCFKSVLWGDINFSYECGVVFFGILWRSHRSQLRGFMGFFGIWPLRNGDLFGSVAGIAGHSSSWFQWWLALGKSWNTVVFTVRWYSSKVNLVDIKSWFLRRLFHVDHHPSKHDLLRKSVITQRWVGCPFLTMSKSEFLCFYLFADGPGL